MKDRISDRFLIEMLLNSLDVLSGFVAASSNAGTDADFYADEAPMALSDALESATELQRRICATQESRGASG